jgi:hypothetical protein
MSNGTYDILDEIISTVNRNGSYEVPLNVLEDTVFEPKQNPYRSKAEQILKWAVENEVYYEYKNNGMDTVVRFY